MDQILMAADIVKTYHTGGEQTAALTHVNMEISRGEFVSVMGPSGSGKSTLLFALSGTDTIDEGSVRIGGETLADLGENHLADLRRTRIGFIFQQPTMLAGLNLLDNILLPAMQERRRDVAALTKKALALMERTGIESLASRGIHEVSGGQLQRAGICRALINDPEILFADEPTGALNTKAADEIMDLLLGIHQGGTAILLVTHDVKVAARSERVLFMLDGRLGGTYTLGSFRAGRDRLKERETALSAWLGEMGL